MLSLRIIPKSELTDPSLMFFAVVVVVAVLLKPQMISFLYLHLFHFEFVIIRYFSKYTLILFFAINYQIHLFSTSKPWLTFLSQGRPYRMIITKSFECYTAITH